MRRVLAFLLLFGGGLALLLYLERRGGRGAGEPEPLPGPTGSAGPVVPAPPTGTNGGGVGLQTAGSGHVAVRGQAGADGRKPLLYQVHWEDSAPAPEGRLELLDVRVLVYEPETGVLEAEVRAERGLVVPDEDTRAMELGIEDEIELFEATITAHAGLPIAPVVLHTSSVKGSLRTRTFTTEERATVAGPGFTASGTGLGLDGEEGRLVFQRDVRAEVTTAEGAVLTLTCRDLLGVRRDPEGGEGALFMTARGAARFAGKEEGAPLLEAEELEMRGRREPGTGENAAESDFVPRRVGARGDVHYRSADLDLTGDEADLELGPAGEVTGGTLSGAAPRAAFVLRPGAGGLIPESATADEPVVLVGQDVLTLERGEEIVVTAPGEARVEWGEVLIETTRGVTSAAAPDGRRARLDARGEVRITHPGGTLSAPGLAAIVEPGPDDDPLLVATAAAPSRTEGVTEDGLPFTFSTAGELVAEVSSGRWSVREARRAALLLHDESEFVARADVVTDFDPETLALFASGAVAVSGISEEERFSASGDELTAESRERFTVTGAPERRATFSGPAGSVEAHSVTRNGNELEALGDVSAQFGGDGIAYDLTCARMTADLASGIGSRTAHAEGEVEGTVRMPGRTVELACESVDVVRSEDEAGAEATTVIATDVEQAFVTLEGEDGEVTERWELRCKRLDAGRVVDAEGATRREDLVAREDVVVTRKTAGAPPFFGFGDRLRFDADGGRLEALPGARVRTSGELPGLGWPFQLDADWVEFDDVRVNAGFPVLSLTRRSEVPEGGGPRTESPMRVQGNELSATESSVLFSGDVEVEGEMSPGVTWRLDTAFARLEGAAPQDVAAPASEGAGASWRALHAWGGYSFRLGASVTSLGERVTAVAGTGRLMLEGEPATLNYGSFRMASAWLELDTITNTWRSGPFTVGQTGGEAQP